MMSTFVMLAMTSATAACVSFPPGIYQGGNAKVGCKDLYNIGGVFTPSETEPGTFDVLGSYEMHATWAPDCPPPDLPRTLGSLTGTASVLGNTLTFDGTVSCDPIYGPPCFPGHAGAFTFTGTGFSTAPPPARAETIVVTSGSMSLPELDNEPAPVTELVLYYLGSG